MALHRKLILNEADYAPFNLYGVGVCMAFSGNGIYRTKGACGTVKGDGSLPPGKYWIVERGSGGFFSRRQADQASLRISCRSSSRIAAMIGIAQSGLSSLYVIYYFAKLFSAYNIKYGFTKNKKYHFCVSRTQIRKIPGWIFAGGLIFIPPRKINQIIHNDIVEKQPINLSILSGMNIVALLSH
jgi:hypothetical protein